MVVKPPPSSGQDSGDTTLQTPPQVRQLFRQLVPMHIAEADDTDTSDDSFVPPDTAPAKPIKPDKKGFLLAWLVSRGNRLAAARV
jgi:hypothetical protein